MGVEEELQQLGSKLDPPPPSKDSLLKLLKQAITILSDVDQSPSASVLDSMQPFLKAIVKPDLLKHQDKDVKLIVASCLCQITRITAPEAPYSDDILKDVFGLIVATFSGLNEISGSAFGKRVIMLEMLARYRSCVVMLDLECDDLVNELFRTFFAVARDDHPENVLTAMETIMFVLLDESEDINEHLLLILLSTLGHNKKDVSEASRKLAMNVIQSCSAKLEPIVKQFLISSMSEDCPLNCHIDYHGVIYDLYCCSPEILLGVIPYITGELLNDQSEARIRAVNLVGELFAVPGSVIPEAFRCIFAEFLKRLTDREVEVRMTVLDFVKKCLLSNPSRPEAAQIYAALCDRLLDYDENVRKQVVAVVCDVACYNLNSVKVDTTRLVAERLRDKSLLVKKYTLDRLTEIYRLCCLQCKEAGANEYDWIPGKIFRCFYDKDFRSDAIEPILCGALFPSEIAVKEIVRHWIRILAGLDKVEVKALEKILEQKQRLQQEMQKYLSLKQTSKDADMSDYDKKVIPLFRVMSRFFVDPAKAEERFLALDQLKDDNIWRILLTLLDPTTSLHQARANQEELLENLGEKHHLFEFMNVLSVKCSYMLFSKEHAKEVLLELASQKSAENPETCLSCANMLVILASYSPLLLVGSEEDLLHLLEDANETVKEGILHVLARAGGTIREQLASSSSSVDLILERLCIEGTRRQAKYAVHALAAITKDDGLRSLSVLCKRLVDMMEDKAHLPTVLQSLGCIAQTAMAVFETRESEIVNFIKSNILEQTHNGQDKTKSRWHGQTELCRLKVANLELFCLMTRAPDSLTTPSSFWADSLSLSNMDESFYPFLRIFSALILEAVYFSKIFGIKVLVKSYLPIKDAHLRGGIDSILELLRNLLTFGEITRDLQSSPVDKAHLKLAAAKAILRLAKYWENKIPVDVFHLTLRTVEIDYRQARKLFLSKVHQYIKDRVLDAKYACAFLLDIFVSKHAEVDEDKHNLADVIQMCRQMKARQHSIQPDASSQLSYPEYMLPFLVHALAHHPICPNVDQCRDVKTVEPLYRILHLFFSMVLPGDEDTAADKSIDIIHTIVSVLQSIKQSEDVVDPLKSKNSHAISELGLLVFKHLTQKSCDSPGVTDSVILPCCLYKLSDRKDDAAEGRDVWAWLAEESVSAHFESLALDVNGAVHLELPQDDILEDLESEGNEMPLGKLIKRIKSQKNKSKEVVKNFSSPPATKNDVDILKVVRDINLDNLMSGNIESSNGHGDLLVSNTSDRENQTEKRKMSDTKATPIPKRKRSVSARGPSRYFSSQNADKHSLKAGSECSSFVQEENEATSSKLVFPSKKKLDSKDSRPKCDEALDVKETCPRDQKKAKVVESNRSKSVRNDKSSAVSFQKQKRSIVSGLAKCTSKEAAGHATDLIDCWINIWWPLDKRFYKGVVKSYDPDKKKHVVLYEDGDVEVLRLDKERWELVDDNLRSKKKNYTAKSPSKQILTNKESNLTECSYVKGSKKRSSSAKGKGSWKKTSKRRRKAVTERKTDNCDEVENKSNVSNEEPSVSSDIDDIKSGDHKGDTIDEGNATQTCYVEKSDTAEGEMDIGSAGTDPEESGKEMKSGSESGHDRGEADSCEDSVNSDLGESYELDHGTEGQRSSKEELSEKAKDGDSEHAPEKNDPCDTGDDEGAEDEPLSTWRRVGKSKKTA